MAEARGLEFESGNTTSIKPSFIYTTPTTMEGEYDTCKNFL